MIEIFIFCLLLGVVAGLLAGLFGIGGGLIIVPVLAWLFENQGFNTSLIMIMAVATSLASIIVTAIASINAHHRIGTINWSIVKRLVPGILLGATLGAVIADNLPNQILRSVFIFYLLFTAIKMALPRPLVTTASINFSAYVLTASGLVIGLLSAILGIGGGTLTVPLLVAGNFAMSQAAGTASACGLPIAIAATISYSLLGAQVELLPEWSFGYIYVPALAGIISTSVMTAPVGARLAKHLPTKTLKRYFSILLFFAAFKLMFLS